jgi:hypothetical protein
MQVAPVHQIQDETEFVGRVKGVRHTDNEWTVLASADKTKHYTFVKCEGFTLLHFDPFFVQTFHGVHFSGIRFPASVYFSESSSTDDPVNGEIVHAQLDVQF